MCDSYTPAGEPIPTNNRFAAAKIFSHPDVAAEVPWYVQFKMYFIFKNFSLFLKHGYLDI